MGTFLSRCFMALDFWSKDKPSVLARSLSCPSSFSKASAPAFLTPLSFFLFNRCKLKEILNVMQHNKKIYWTTTNTFIIKKTHSHTGKYSQDSSKHIIPHLCDDVAFLYFIFSNKWRERVWIISVRFREYVWLYQGLRANIVPTTVTPIISQMLDIQYL